MINTIGVLRKEELKNIREKYDIFHDRDLLIMNLEASTETNRLLKKLIGRKEKTELETELLPVKEIASKFGVHEKTVRNKVKNGVLQKHPSTGVYDYLVSVHECTKIKLRGYSKTQ